jgi:glyoxylase I family protein
MPGKSQDLIETVTEAGISRRRLAQRLALGAVGIAGVTLTGAAKAADAPASAASAAFLHIGLCVADMERSVRFYRDGLGFEAGEGHAIENQFGKLLEIDGDSAHQNLMIKKDGISIELIHFKGADPKKKTRRRPMNQPGLTHLAFRVDDVDGTLARIRDLGGTVLDQTRTTLGTVGKGSNLIFCTDPDGTRIEITGALKA